MHIGFVHVNIPRSLVQQGARGVQFGLHIGQHLINGRELHNGLTKLLALIGIGHRLAISRKQFGKAIVQFPAVYEMLANMKAKLDASRTLLYETSRYVDVYKTYMHIAEERSLTKEERADMKYYQRLADFFTPLLKGMTSEYCNQLAYDSLQIHGGSGFMKDYPIERIYRDARITTIYEGTTQLQVVAAIRGVTTGAYLSRIREFEEMAIKPELHGFRRILIGMTEEYEKAVKQVVEIKDNEYLDFHARRLVEMAGHIIMGYLLLLDTERDDRFRSSTEIYLRYGRAENRARAAYIAEFSIDDLGFFKP